MKTRKDSGFESTFQFIQKYMSKRVEFTGEYRSEIDVDYMTRVYH